jgi:hypothetical protein
MPVCKYEVHDDTADGDLIEVVILLILFTFIPLIAYLVRTHWTTSRARVDVRITI